MNEKAKIRYALPDKGSNNPMDKKAKIGYAPADKGSNPKLEMHRPTQKTHDISKCACHTGYHKVHLKIHMSPIKAHVDNNKSKCADRYAPPVTGLGIPI